jgi:hypothetical protein
MTFKYKITSRLLENDIKNAHKNGSLKNDGNSKLNMFQAPACP